MTVVIIFQDTASLLIVKDVFEIAIRLNLPSLQLVLCDVAVAKVSPYINLFTFGPLRSVVKSVDPNLLNGSESFS